METTIASLTRERDEARRAAAFLAAFITSAVFSGPLDEVEAFTDERLDEAYVQTGGTPPDVE